jgi:hypothetical protein
VNEQAASIPLRDLPYDAMAATRAAEVAFPVRRTVKLSMSAKGKKRR